MSEICLRFERVAPCLLSALRIVVAVMMLQHGGQKVFGYPTPGPNGVPPLGSIFGIAGLLELVGGAFLLLGLFTRIAAFILSGEMAVAYFMVHSPLAKSPIHNHGELAVIYCFVCLYLAAAGGGSLSVDNCIKRRRGSV